MVLTVSEALRIAQSRLLAAGVPDPALDAELILRHVLRWDRARLLADALSLLGPADEERFLSLVGERAARRPLQHIVGTQAFWRHDFLVTPDVLIPRPETEILVEACLKELEGRDAPRVVDLGTGSGCIAISLALERSDAELHAVDASPAAVALARVNASRLGASRVAFHTGDLLKPTSGSFDLIASNPPYVDASEAAELQPEVRDHEPLQALVPPGGDRYGVYKRLVPDAARALAPGGALVLEIGQGMDVEVTRLCREAGLTVDRIVPDLQGIPRTVVARRPGYPPASAPE